jgi:hypothetical protein
MTEQHRKRPKRLWIAALLNILAGTISLGALVFLSLSTQVPESLRLDASATVVAGLSTSMLILWSVLALLGIRWARYLMLVAALLFYGGILIQNIQLYLQVDEGQPGTRQLVAHVVRSGFDIALNLWALLSAKTGRYFAQRPDSGDAVGATDAAAGNPG